MFFLLGACGAEQEQTEEAGNPEPAAAAPGTGSGAVLVTVKQLNPERFDHYFQANGSVEAVNDAFISPEINGRIKTIHVKEGQRVKAGTLLVSLNAEVIESGIAEAKSGLELAATVYEKRKGLWDKKIGSEIEYLQAKTNKESLENKLKSLKAQLKMARITAPISGIVDDVLGKEGELALPGVQLIRVVNLKTVYLNADVSEAYIAAVSKGDTAKATFPSYPGMTIDTVIHRTGNVIKAQNRTFLVQLKLDNKDEKLKPNLMGIIKMKDFTADAALTAPSIVIKNDLKGSYLYVAETKEGKTLARKTYVETGMSEASDTMITKGLEPGARVIVEGYSLVKNGREIQIKK